jgi:phospholipase C
MLIITWDEHGGFYDHAAPPAAVAPGDSAQNSQHNQFGFTFEQYGVRVPAVVISPLIPRNLIDHRIYDHTSILATVEALFGVAPLTDRDAAANPLTALASLTAPRTDAPATLPEPQHAPGGCPPCVCGAPPMLPALTRAADPINLGNAPAVLHAALRSELALSPSDAREQIMARFSAIKTRADARSFVDNVRQKQMVPKA